MSPDEQKPKVIVICGPTGVGKTSVAIETAEVFNGEIISADSMQIYRHMNIGTAKPTLYEQSCIPHHMIDIVDPDEPFNAAEYAKMAYEIMLKLHGHGIIPFVVGGTGLYIKALIHGLFSDGQVDPRIRKHLKDTAAIHGPEFLYHRLIECDPETAKKIHPNDTHRIIRALEVLEITGKSISKYHREHRFTDKPFKVLKIGLHMDREVLYNRINRRVDTMMAAGLVDEVKGLLGMNYTKDLKSMQSIGYRHVVDFIEGSLSWDETIRTLKRDTRRYAKRQLTWYKADSEIVWIEPDRLSDIRRIIKSFLND